MEVLKRNPSPKAAAFTLAELIVVIAILAILGTIGFLSLQGYSASARDSERISDLALMSKGLDLQVAAGKLLPQPDTNVLTIISSGSTLGYQGYAGTGVQNAAAFGGKGRDPLDSFYYTYLVNSNKNKYQLLALMEGASGSSYATRTPNSRGSQLGVLLGTGSTPNQPVQEQGISSVDVSTTATPYTVFFSSSYAVSGTGTVIAAPMVTAFSTVVSTGCLDGFIQVPGNSEIGQSSFCVAKYEMTYADADTPNSTGGGTDWNTVSYSAGKAPISIPGKLPIADITQPQAISACQSLGAGYHLVTNNEWMTIARDIESTAANWTSGTVGAGGIYRGITSESNTVSSLGCATANSAGASTRTYAAKTLVADTVKFGTGKTSDCDSKRQHMLSNGQIIWDIAGNVWEHVNKANTLDGSGFNDANSWKSDVCSGINTWASFYANDGVSGCVYSNGYSYANIGPKTPNLNANYGIGRIYSRNVTNAVLSRGGSAYNSTYAGIFSYSPDWTASDSSRIAGFRCAK